MFKKEISECKKCSLSPNGRPLEGWGSGNKIFIIGLAPSDFRRGDYTKAMKSISVADTANLLESCLKECGINESDFYITNLVKCSFPENKLDRALLETCYNEWLIKEIVSITPNTIVCLGNEVYDFLSQKPYIEDMFILKKALHHSYIARNRSKYEDWVNEWKKISY